MTDRSWQDFSTAARRLILSLAEGSPIDAITLHRVQTHLDAKLARKYPALQAVDRGDAIADVIVSLLVAARKGRIDPNGNPGGYIWQAAQHRAVDQFRKPTEVSLETVIETRGESDDAVAAYLEAEASAQEVEEAMALLAMRGEHQTNSAISEWLVLAQRLERAPTTRQAGEALGISHDSVARHLQKFKAALLEARSQRQ